MPKRQSEAWVIALIGLMFFIFGFVTWLNGPLIAFVKLAFALNDVEAFFVPMVFYASYLFLALPSAAILRRTGMKRGMVLGLLVMAGGAAIFGQFATSRLFGGALTGLFILGGGLALLQTAANPYISIVGPIESAAKRIAVMGICSKFAGILAPIAFGVLVMRDVDRLNQAVAAAKDGSAREALLEAFARQIHAPYLAMAGVLALLAVGVALSRLPDIRPDVSSTETSHGSRGLLSFPHLWLGVLCLFLYVGVEVMAGDAIGTYGAGFGLPVAQTAYFTSLTLTGMLVGYVLGVLLVPRVFSQSRYLAMSAALGLAAVAGAYLTHGYASVGFVALLGLANAMMWPAIFPLAIGGLGRHTEVGSAFLIMAICGGAVVPQLFVVLKQHLDFQLVFLLIMAPAYAYILFYGVVGHRTGRRLAA